MRHFVRLAPVALLAAAATAPDSHASIIRITATGSVTASNMGAFAVGQSMTMVLEYETNGGPQFIANQQAFYVDHMTSISFSSGSWNTSASGAFGQIDKYDNLGNTDGIQFQVAANPATYQYTNPKPHTVNLASIGGSVFDNAILNFASFSNSIWNDYALPTSYNFADFNQVQNGIFAFSDGSFMIGWGAVHAEVVPAPGVAAMLGAGLLGARRRRR